MSNKNLFAHPCVVKVKRQQKEMDGKNVTYFVMDLLWEQREDVPLDMQGAALALFTQVQTAHEAGKFRSDRETKDDFDEA